MNISASSCERRTQKREKLIRNRKMEMTQTEVYDDVVASQAPHMSQQLNAEAQSQPLTCADDEDEVVMQSQVSCAQTQPYSSQCERSDTDDAQELRRVTIVENGGNVADAAALNIVC